MSLSDVEDTLKLLSAMEGISGLADADRHIIRAKSDALPALVKGVSKLWEQIGRKETLSDDELRAVYAVLRASGAGEVAPFERLLRALKARIDEGLLSAEELYRWGVELDRLSPRVPGTTAMDQGSDYIAHKLQSFGIEALREPINFRGVFFHEWSFEITSPEKRSFVSFPENNVGFGEISSELVDIGRGREEDYAGKDVKGKLLLMNWGELWEHEGPCALRQRYGLLHLYDLAYQHGAAGIAGYFTDTPGNTLRLLEPGIRPTGGSNIPGPAESGPHNGFAIPALNIGRQDALALKELLASGPAAARLVVKGVRKVSTTDIVAGFLPGRSSQTIAVGSHSCTAFEGAVCDTVGVVGTLALAKYFASLPAEKREKSMLFFFDSFHVWGNCCQTALTLFARRPELTARVEAFLWLDHLSDGRPDTPRPTITSDNPVLWPLTALAMAKRGIAPLALPVARIWSLCATGAHERRGISTITMQAMNADTLTPEDNWHKFDKDTLFRDILAHVELAQALHIIDVPHNTPGEPVGGCGSLFIWPETPAYPEGEQYVPEQDYPLYVGGGASPVRVLQTQNEKDAFVGVK